ncbi:MAG TPA: hypothetical protein G4N98_08350 [Thermoflexia bacterium]|nr:hypothetical protein [Thermoflexia bacterium]
MSWNQPPFDTQSFVLIMDAPDAVAAIWKPQLLRC